MWPLMTGIHDFRDGEKMPNFEQCSSNYFQFLQSILILVQSTFPHRKILTLLEDFLLEDLNGIWEEIGSQKRTRCKISLPDMPKECERVE
ncbi:hypothetical protein HNY73_021329 [Argiope bruennichi]|uniref:Uncharacterized protein n=1 Tax=Argiope bruennichi TaxID=94029 RepID=A0A8T0E1E0_ARGBR|nr:hypothetical protein HNY73_021329 [Argiope bruennichi]